MVFVSGEFVVKTNSALAVKVKRQRMIWIIFIPTLSHKRIKMSTIKTEYGWSKVGIPILTGPGSIVHAIPAGIEPTLILKKSE
jgi:hypothetical protein